MCRYEPIAAVAALPGAAQAGASFSRESQTTRLPAAARRAMYVRSLGKEG
jgi:hypothetical protein